MDKKHNNLAQPETDAFVRIQGNKKSAIHTNDQKGIKHNSSKGSQPS